MLVRLLHDRLMLGGTLLVALGVVTSRLLGGGWATAGLVVGIAGAVLLIAGIWMKTAAGR